MHEGKGKAFGRPDRDSRCFLQGARRFYPVRANFTLIELLLVVAIIAILLAILLPALQVTRKKALQVECLNNQRQISMAVTVAMNDSNNKYVVFWGNNPSLYDLIQKKYLPKNNRLIFCPAVGPFLGRSVSSLRPGNDYRYYYSFRKRPYYDTNAQQAKVKMAFGDCVRLETYYRNANCPQDTMAYYAYNRLRAPSKSIVIADGYDIFGKQLFPDFDPVTGGHIVHLRHLYSGIVSCADGHAEVNNGRYLVSEFYVNYIVSSYGCNW